MSNIQLRPLPDLTEIQQPDDGGATNLIGLRYQFHYAVKLCIEMLRNPGTIEYVACELHDDVVAKLTNGSYGFYQAKMKNDGLWTISLLDSEGVWKRFWNLSQKFGSGHTYGFVSDQHCMLKSKNTYDLKRLKYLTDKGFDKCNTSERIEAEAFITRLMTILNVTDKMGVTSLFWGLRITTGLEKSKGQFALTLLEIEELLLSRNIDSDPKNRLRIYRTIISLIEEKIAEPAAEMTMIERLEYRKVCAAEIEECISGPFREIRLQSFDTTNSDKKIQSLTSKMQDAQFPPRLLNYFIETRNLFEIRYRKDRINAEEYLNQLRIIVWTVCIEQSRQPAQEYMAAKAYDRIWSELKLLVQRVALQNPPITIDFEYLHGMLCQLTAECNNEWTPIG